LYTGALAVSIGNQRKAKLFFLEPRRVLEEYGIRPAPVYLFPPFRTKLVSG